MIYRKQAANFAFLRTAAVVFSTDYIRILCMFCDIILHTGVTLLVTEYAWKEELTHEDQMGANADQFCHIFGIDVWWMAFL